MVRHESRCAPTARQHCSSHISSRAAVRGRAGQPCYERMRARRRPAKDAGRRSRTQRHAGGVPPPPAIRRPRDGRCWRPRPRGRRSHSGRPPPRSLSAAPPCPCRGKRPQHRRSHRPRRRLRVRSPPVAEFLRKRAGHGRAGAARRGAGRGAVCREGGVRARAAQPAPRRLHRPRHGALPAVLSPHALHPCQPDSLHSSACALPSTAGATRRAAARQRGVVARRRVAWVPAAWPGVSAAGNAVARHMAPAPPARRVRQLQFSCNSQACSSRSA